MPYSIQRTESPVTVASTSPRSIVEAAAELAKSVHELVQALKETADKTTAKSSEVIQNQPTVPVMPPVKLGIRPILSSDRPKEKKAIQKISTPEKNNKATIEAKVIDGMKVTDLPIEKELKDARSISISPRGSLMSSKTSDTMEILSFNFKGNVRRFKVHLPEGWFKVEHPEERQLWMRSGTKKQIELQNGENIMVNQKTGKIFVVTVIPPKA